VGLVEAGTLILIVDDDADVRHGIADVLGLEGYEVRLHSSADAAWSDISRGAEPAVVILDLWLPGMSSSEFIRRLRASRASALPILVLSGAPAAEHTEADVDAVCQKPIEATALVHAVDKLVRLRSRRQRAAPLRVPRRQVGDRVRGRRRPGAVKRSV
jgi:DNA-binding response OmpR family regulator